MKQPKNITELTNDLAKVYAELRNKEIGEPAAKTAANVAGKLIGACKVTIEYQKMTGDKTPITFLQTNLK